jgi:hypothetical protein
MKSELTTVQPKANPFPKLMKHKEFGTIIAATYQAGNSITGTCVWVTPEFKEHLLRYSETWGADKFKDLPRHECVILSNQ